MCSGNVYRIFFVSVPKSVRLIGVFVWKSMHILFNVKFFKFENKINYIIIWSFFYLYEHYIHLNKYEKKKYLFNFYLVSDIWETRSSRKALIRTSIFPLFAGGLKVATSFRKISRFFLPLALFRPPFFLRHPSLIIFKYRFPSRP